MFPIEQPIHRSVPPVALWILAIFCAFMCACSSSKHVPDGSYLLDKVHIRLDSVGREEQLDVTEMQAYLRQTPNHRMLWSIKFRLGFYNLAGNDSTNWWSRWMRKLGEPPVIYNPALSEASVGQLIQYLANKGYFNADVAIDSVKNEKKKKIELTYKLSPGPQKVISQMEYEFPDSAVKNIIMADSSRFLTYPGQPLSRDILENQRTLVADALRDNGYYNFGKECITFVADTTEGSSDVELLMKVNYPSGPQKDRLDFYSKFIIRKVTVIADANSIDSENPALAIGKDSINYHGIEILYYDSKYLRPSVIADNCYLAPGDVFSQKNVDRTYRAFSRLGILKFINVSFIPVGQIGDEGLLDAYVMLTPGKSQTASVELEGTNSEGDLGVAVGLTYSHRNIGRGSETFTGKLRGSYESLSGNLEGLLNNRYMEYSVDMGLSMPEFKAPISRRIRRRIQASTEMNFSMNYQERPEYTHSL
ncbi:MAG: outer membrane protein assembly factor, partial [Muribaculaceae bacterium]|nr:outer membrane protein assembly factor [Muribaculaceae bacterium]